MFTKPTTTKYGTIPTTTCSGAFNPRAAAQTLISYRRPWKELLSLSTFSLPTSLRIHVPNSSQPHLLSLQLLPRDPHHYLPQPPMAPDLHDRLLSPLPPLAVPLLLQR
uniref:Uncharacterized protein n=1 Tax=Opuntia streptacantha TaxID=393608 RepID=A0A7C8ZHQ0_OPUST